MRKLLLTNLFIQEVNNIVQSGALLLREENTNRHLVMWTGAAEINSILSTREGVRFERPSTHDLCVSFIKELSASVDYVVIDDLQNNIYYATIVLQIGQETKKFDASPGDAIAIAIRSNAYIFAEESVLDSAAVTEEEALETFQNGSGQTPPTTKDTPENLGPFRQFIEEELPDLDNLGSDNPDDTQPA